MSVWGNIFAGILGGISESSKQKSSERATKEATKEAGKQDRITSQFNAEQEYYYNQKMRHEKARALGTGYNQFSTVREFAPGYVAGTGLDALPTKPSAKEYYNG